MNQNLSKSELIKSIRKELDRINLRKYSRRYVKIPINLGLEIAAVSRSYITFTKTRPNMVFTYEESITSPKVSKNILMMVYGKLKTLS